jgi:hypothetical protein
MSLYERLESRQTRVLMLHPSKKWSHPIECDMGVIDLDEISISDVMEFEALSYVWGDRAGGSEIIVNGINKSVSPNLEKALRYLRERKVKRLWVDYVCINQESKPERSEQVRIMSDIYRDAKRVLVWLGEGDDSVRKTVTWMKSNLLPGSSSMEDSQESPKAKPAYLVDGMSRLAHDMYWHRMWTCQEFALAHDDPVIIVGDVSFKAGYLWPALEASGLIQDMSMLLTKGGRLNKAYSSGFLSMQTSLLIRHAMMRRGQIPYQILPRLGLFLCLTWARGCVDDHDKIFALYGLFGNKNLPAPDYEKKIEDVIAEAVAFIINQEKDLDIFGFLALYRNTKQTSAPSWLPDLFNGSSSSEKCPSHFMTRDICSATDLLVGGSKATTPRSLVEPDLKTLILTGVSIDRVRSILVLEGSVSRIIAQRESIEEAIQSVRREANQRSSNLPQSTVSLATVVLKAQEQSLWQTLAPRMNSHEGEALNSGDRDKLIEDFFKLEGRVPLQEGQDVQYSLEHMFGRTFFITTSGIFGVGPPEIIEGDELCLMSNVKLPMLLRRSAFGKSKDSEIFRMVGSVYVSSLKHKIVNSIPGIRTRIREFRIQ